MALPTKSQLETLTDSLAAAIGIEMSGHRQASLAPGGGSFRTITDGFGNPDLEDLLNPVAAALDADLWGEGANLQRLAAKYGPLLTALSRAVQEDGTYADFNAYVTAVGAQIAPEVAAIAALTGALGTRLDPLNAFSPAIETAAPDKVFAGTDGALADVGVDAVDAGTADVDLFESQGDALYLGFDSRPVGVAAGGVNYEYLTIALSTGSSANVGLTTQYWNGTAWVNLDCQYPNATVWTDLVQSAAESGTTFGIKGFTQGGVIRFAIPGNWARCSVNPAGDPLFEDDQSPRFYLRFSRTAVTVATTPILSHLRAGIGAGLAMITAANTVLFVPGSGVDTNYDAVNQIRFRALTPISANVTATIGYTNRAGTTGRSQVQSAWSSIDGLDTFPDPGFLTLQAANEGVRQISSVTATTTATSGIFALESVPPRIPVR